MKEPEECTEQAEAPDKTQQHGYNSWTPEERAEYNAMYDR